MAQTAAKNAGTVANDASAGNTAWSNPTNAQGSSDATAATSSVTGTNTTQRLKATNFGFTSSDLPAGAVIDGIQVDVRHTAGTANRVSDSELFVVKGGATQTAASNLASATKWANSIATFTYGGPSELFGLSWAQADILSSGFGVSLRAKGSNTATTSVEWFDLSVFYHLNVPGAAAVAGGGQVSATGTRVRPGAAALSGSGGVSVSGTVVSGAVHGAAALAGSGAVTAAGTRTTSGAAAVAGTGALAAGGLRLTFARAALAGSGRITAAGVRETFQGASVAGSGRLTAAGVRATFAAAALSGRGALGASWGGGAISGSASIAGSGRVAAAGARTASTGAAIAGRGALSAGGLRIVTGTARLDTGGRVVVAGRRSTFAGANLAGAGQVTVVVGSLTGHVALTDTAAWSASVRDSDTETGYVEVRNSPLASVALADSRVA